MNDIRIVRITKYHLSKEKLKVRKSINSDLIWAFVASFTGIGLISWFNSILLDANDYLFLIGSIGASAVILYGTPKSQLAKPRNLFGGHLISAFIGVTLHQFGPDALWLSTALAVSFALVLMIVTHTFHPPGGATALIALIGSEKVKSLGYLYILSPVLSGLLILYFTYRIVFLFKKVRNINL